MSETLPAPASAAAAQADPFATVAQLLHALRESLESSKRPGQAPRWVRIARIRAYRGESDFISRAVIPAVDSGLAFTVSYLAHLTLQANDLLTQADSAKALGETSGEMLRVVTSEPVATGLATAINQQGVVTTLRDARVVIERVAGFVDQVPDQDDLDSIKSALYALLCLEQLPLSDGGLGASSEAHLNLDASGKIRLLQLALDKPVRVRGLGASKQGEQELRYLGSRRIWPAAASSLPVKAIGRWGTQNDSEIIYEVDFSQPGVAGGDIAEANALLEALGYLEPAVTDASVFDDALQRRLRRFQKVNGLAITGQLDNPTLNGLQHLNHATKSLQRAKPYDAEALRDFDDGANAVASAPSATATARGRRR